MKHKFLSLLVAIAASVGMMNAAIINGTCGDNLTWTLNTKDSTLTIEGSGVMSDWLWQTRPGDNYSWTSTATPWSEYNTYIVYVSLPDGLINIGNKAFSECRRLRSVNIPNSVTSIGYNAFVQCQSLLAVTIPNNVTSIGGSAFYGCSSLTSVDIPNGVTSIGSDAFHYCSGLTSVNIPNSVTSIGAAAFTSCSNITSITIPNGVTSIKKETFKFCSMLTSITIPNSVTSIEESAFHGCGMLTSITIPNSVTSIGESAYRYCGITSITIPNNVTSIGNTAFANCNLSSITCEAVTPPSIKNQTFLGVDKSIPLLVPLESIEAYSDSLGWEEFTNIYAIGTILDIYRVEFRDADGTILKVDSVRHGSAATAPSDPYREGYTFTGWDKSFDNITSDLVVTAQYELGEVKEYYITFSDKEGYSILYNTVQLKVPAAPGISGFTFIGWRPVADMIQYNNIEIEAVYEADELTSAPEVYINPSNTAQKLIKNGNVYILHEDKTYTIQGQKVK